MKKLNRKGFTLIELLAVITIMGILLLVAIPAISRTIENSRRDTYMDIAKTYINTVRNSVLADEMTCGGTNVAATANGTYYFKIDSNEQATKDLMQSGGLSSWSNSKVGGYVQWTKTATSDDRSTLSFSILLVDEGKHGIDTATAEESLTRSSVKTATTIFYGGSGTAAVPTGSGTACTLN